METDRHSPFGALLRQFREAAGLSQEQLAERTGLSQRGISDLERGLRTAPRPETFRMLADGLDLTDLQRTQLRTAIAATKPSSFHPSAHAPPGIPTPSSPFIGRAGDLESIAGTLENEKARLITLTGPGGVGKTRIAVEAARRLANRYVHGAMFVDLAPVRKPEMVVPAIAERLGVRNQGDHHIREILAVALHDRAMLMVLDNFEQVIDAAVDIAWLLAACQQVRVIATSRVPLHVAAEHVLPIEPMTLPVSDDLASLEESEAVTLFVARARAADHPFVLNQENASAVAALVTRLQGMPLAIELAATRVRMWSLPELLQRLESQLPVLSGGARDTPARHRTMRDTIAWSYDLMSTPERAIFRTLSIFPEGCTLETAIAILGMHNRFGEAEAINAMELLVDSSILHRRVVADGRVRYRMMQPVREFGLEQLVAADEETMARRAAHEAWCLPLAQQTELGIAQPNALERLNQTGAEYQNLREHIAWLMHHDYMQEALYVSGAIAPFRALRGHFKECRDELELLLAHPRNQEGNLDRLRAQVWLGIICLNQADIGKARETLNTALGLGRELDAQRWIAIGLLALGVTELLAGDLEKAEALEVEGLSLSTSLGETVGVSRGSRYLGLILDQRGQSDRARELINQGLATALAADNHWDVAFCKLDLASMDIRAGELDRAEELLQEVEELFIELDDRRDRPSVYIKRAEIARLRGDLGQATTRLEDALAMAREFGSMLDMAHSHLGLARIAQMESDLVASCWHSFRAIHWYERCGNTVDAIRCLDHLADIALLRGDPARAAWCIGAVDGVLARRSITRSELVPGEHEARRQSVRASMDDDAWHRHHDRASDMSESELLTEVRSWLSHHISRAGMPQASGQTVQSDYDGDTR